MGTTNGYKSKFEKKKDIIYNRMDVSMIQALNDIKEKKGINKSELVGESAMCLLSEVKNKGEVGISI